MPSCGRARCRIGWTRSRAKALVEPPFGGHDGRECRVARALARRRVVRFVERAHQNVGAAGQLIHVHAGGEGLRAIDSERGQAVTLRPLTARSADTTHLHIVVHRRETSEEAQRLLALAEDADSVTQSRESLAQALDLAREQLILVLERATPRDVHAARQRGTAEDEEQQREQSADADQCFDDGLRHFHGAGRPRSVGDQHDGPAPLGLFLLHGRANIRLIARPRQIAKCALRHLCAGSELSRDGLGE